MVALACLSQPPNSKKHLSRVGAKVAGDSSRPCMTQNPVALLVAQLAASSVEGQYVRGTASLSAQASQELPFIAGLNDGAASATPTAPPQVLLLSCTDSTQPAVLAACSTDCCDSSLPAWLYESVFQQACA